MERLYTAVDGKHLFPAIFHFAQFVFGFKKVLYRLVVLATILKTNAILVMNGMLVPG